MAEPHDTTARGEVSAQTAVISSLLFSMVFLVVSLASWWTSTQTAAVAAERGAFVASRMGAVAGMDAVEQAVVDLGGQLASAPLVSRSGHIVTVVVSVRVGSPGGLLPGSTTRRRTVAVEEFLGEDER